MSERWRGALNAPMFATLASFLDRLPVERFPGVADLNAITDAGVVSGGGAPIRFVSPDPPSKAFEAQYEVRVFMKGEVQTRTDNWHDLFNALVWLTFPKSKAILNRHHYHQIEARLGEKLRGTARDVLTLFDEGGIVVASAEAELSTLLLEFHWKELFWHRRADVVRAMRFFVFGHAIYEKALQPYKGVTAKALILDVASDYFSAGIERQLAQLDERVATYFSDAGALRSTRQLSPLPVLGVPGWEAENENEHYYDDTSQFRVGRIGKDEARRTRGKTQT